MITYRDITRALDELDIQAHSRLILHAAIGPFGKVAGGEESLIGAVINRSELVIAPSFTHQTMITPSVGPPDNAVEYGVDEDANLDAAIFHPGLEVDAELGSVNETLLTHPQAERSSHPILSFVGINASEALATQRQDAPLAPIAWLADYDGDVLMMGRDHCANVSLHWGEQLAGRKTFVRWALTAEGVVECVNMPGCAHGFDAVRSRLGAIARSTKLNAVVLEAIPLRDLLNLTVGWIREDPRALLCDKAGCPHCVAVRADVRANRPIGK
jgi:aminoglycoside 3-N-acetyltransferase